MLQRNPDPNSTKWPVVTTAAMEEYFDKIAELNEEYPECWHLLVQAEDRCRGERLERIKRRLTQARTQLAKHMTRPAQNFLLRGGAGRVMPKEVAEDVNVSDSEEASLWRRAFKAGKKAEEGQRER